jgi:hypothetical protein
MEKYEVEKTSDGQRILMIPGAIPVKRLSAVEEATQMGETMFNRGQRLGAMKNLVAQLTVLPRQLVQMKADDIHGFFLNGDESPDVYRENDYNEYHDLKYSGDLADFTGLKARFKRRFLNSARQEEEERALSHWKVSWPVVGEELHQRFQMRYMADGQGVVIVKDFGLDLSERDSRSGLIGSSLFSFNWTLNDYLDHQWVDEPEKIQFDWYHRADSLIEALVPEGLVRTLIEEIPYPSYSTYCRIGLSLSEKPTITGSSQFGGGTFKAIYDYDPDTHHLERSFDNLYLVSNIGKTRILSRTFLEPVEFAEITSTIFRVAGLN